MHGTETIHKINELAAQNAPGATGKAIAAANEKRGASPLQVALDEHQQRPTREQRERLVEQVARSSVEELVERVRNTTFSSILEEAMVVKLQRLREASSVVTDEAYLDR